MDYERYDSTPSLRSPGVDETVGARSVHSPSLNLFCLVMPTHQRHQRTGSGDVLQVCSYAVHARRKLGSMQWLADTCGD